MPFLILLLMIVIWIGCWFKYDGYSRRGSPGVIVIAVATAILGFGALMADYAHTDERTIVVEGKDRGKEDEYRIYTDGDTLVVNDITFSFNPRQDRADLFGDIIVCHKYRVLVRGWEFGLFDLMPNIDTVLEDLGPVEGCVPKV